jgi:hypothetical protein
MHVIVFIFFAIILDNRKTNGVIPHLIMRLFRSFKRPGWFAAEVLNTEDCKKQTSGNDRFITIFA